MTFINRKNATWGDLGREVDETDANPLFKFQQQAVPSLRRIRSLGGNLGSTFGREDETEGNPLSRFKQPAMLLSNETSSLRAIRSVGGNLGSTLGREVVDKTADTNPISEFQQQALPSNEKSSLRRVRSFGGNLGSLFGLEKDKADANNPLSEFQQQSLSVFESKHMWAHFKANLAESNIQTTAGVRAMLPEFVNDRILDGSIRSEQRSVNSASMTHQQSVTNRAPREPRSPLGGSSNRSLDVSERSNSIDAYSQALRGESVHVICLHESVNTEVQKNIDARGLGKVIPTRLSIDISLRRSSLISSLGWCDDPCIDVQSNSSENKKSAHILNSFTSLDLSSRRSRILSTLGLTKEVPLDNSLSTGETDGMSDYSARRPKFVRPVDFDTEQAFEQETADIFDGNSVKISNATCIEVDTIRSKPYSYRPSRMGEKATVKIEKNAPSELSRVRNTLLVEWGEKDDLSSDDEADEQDFHKLNDSERTVAMKRKDLIVGWNDKEDDDDDWIEDALDHDSY